MSPPDWGRFLYKFDLGLLSLDFEAQPSILKSGAGGAQVFQMLFRGSYYLSSFVGAFVCGAVRKIRQDRTGQDKTKTKTQDTRHKT